MPFGDSTGECAIYDLFTSGLDRQVVSLALARGLFDCLGREVLTASQVSTRLAIGPRSAEAILAVLTALGLTIFSGGRYAITPSAHEYFMPGGRSDARVLFSAAISKELLMVIETDQPLQPDRPLAWAKGRVLPDTSDSIGRMHALTLASATKLAESGAFADRQGVLDVGGGSGAMVAALAQKYPQVRLGIFELPEICPLTTTFLKDAGVAERVLFHGGDMFRSPLPKGYDTVLLSNMMHDWPPDLCRQILCQVRQALPAGGRVVLHEMVLDEDRRGPLTVALFSFMMLLTTLGKQYTLSELATLLDSAGFEPPLRCAGHGYFSIVTSESRS